MVLPNSLSSYYEKFIATGEVRCIDEEIPFEIPKSWEWSRLGDICSYLHRGKSPKYGEHKFLPIIAQKCNQWDKIYTDRCLFSSKDYIEKYKEEQFVQKGDIIINSTGGGTVGRTGYIDSYVFANFDRFVVDSHVTLVRSIYPIASKYVYYFLISPLIQIGLEDRCSGSTNQIELGTTTITSYLIPIPPIKEQYRIIDQFQKVLPLLERYSTNQIAQDKLNAEINIQLKKSILQEAIQGKLVPQITEEGTAQELLEQIKLEKQKLIKNGKLKKSALTDSVIYRGDDNKYYEQVGKEIKEITEEILFDLPDKWQWCRIGTIFMHNNGKQLNKGNTKGKLMKYVTTSNLYWDGFVLDNLKEMPFKENEIERCMAVKGDLLVCEGGDIGRSCIWNYDFPIMLQNHIHKLRPYIPVCTKFFYYIFNLYNLTGLIGGKGIGIQGFSSKALHNTLVPLPPLKEQHRIVAQIEKLFEQLR